jgi:predicted amidophosphoribosyltransferase
MTTPPTPPQHQAMFARITQGPAPYRRGPDENTRCPACGKYSEPDAKYCDQCGGHLPPPAPTKPYIRGPGEDILCKMDQKYNAADARYCSQCGNKLPATAFEQGANPSNGQPQPQQPQQPQAPGSPTQ